MISVACAHAKKMITACAQNAHSKINQKKSARLFLSWGFSEQLIDRCTVSTSLLFAVLQPYLLQCAAFIKSNPMQDQHFDDLSIRFAQKIYGSNKGAIRLAVLQADLN